MDNALKSIENNALAALTQRAPTAIVNAIKTASAKTGVSFSYLMEKAAAESSFNPTVKAKTSSATGLFQFLDSTWMDMVNKHGDKYGIDKNQSKSALLDLRKDPEISSCMAGEFAQDNKDYLEQTIGGDVGNTELYFAHFMGAGGASSFLSQLKKNPLALGADLFPKEASANKNVFYNSKTGAPKSLQQIYDTFDKKFSGDETIACAPTNSLGLKNTVKRTAGYQHIPFSMKKPITIIDAQSSQNLSSLYQVQQQLDDYFATPASISSLYSNLKNPSSMLLDILK